MTGWAFRAWWLRREWKALLLLFGFAALAVAIGLYAVSQYRGSSRIETGEIVRFGTHHDYEGNRPVVLVRMTDGTLRQLRAHRSALLGCRRGDSIALVRRGAILGVHPAGCRRQASDGR